MEENKTTLKVAGGKASSKEKVKQEEVKQPKKISYEELMQVANNLHQQNQKLQQELYMCNNDQAIHRMNFLFAVVKYDHMFDEEFVKKVLMEIQEVLYPSEEVNEESNEIKE